MSNYQIRTSKATSANKEYVRKASGGWSDCVKGNPMDSQCDALANCVGHAEARFNEIINQVRGTSGLTYANLNCNAENFIERAQSKGLKTGSEPRNGAIMCWQKGATLSGSDGAGHVAIAEHVLENKTKIYTSESGYGSKAFWNAYRTNSNGRWGSGSAYTFRGFIYLPDDVQAAIDAILDPVVTDPFPGVSDEDLAKRVWAGEFGNGDARKNALGSRYAAVQALVDKGVGKPAETTPVTPTPAAVVVDNSLKVGDTVKIIGTGNGSSYGTSGTAYGIGWTRKVLKIWEGRKYPYQIGNNTGTTGFYQESALEKK